MTYYSDLSPYVYFPRAESPAVNIGWLDDAHDFPKGEVSDDFIVRLKRYIDYPVYNLCFGFHRCEICKEGTGSGEIRVIGKNGLVYAAPMMIVHYIQDHLYLPPDEFIQAVLDSPLPSSAEYRVMAQNYSWYRFSKYWPEE